MPFRLSEHRAKIQFLSGAWMPHMIYKACVKTDTVSNTRYIQEAVCAALSRDLDIPLEDLLEALPTPRGLAATRLHETGVLIPVPARTDEEIR